MDYVQSFAETNGCIAEGIVNVVLYYGPERRVYYGPQKRVSHHNSDEYNNINTITLRSNDQQYHRWDPHQPRFEDRSAVAKLLISISTVGSHMRHG